MSTPIKKIDLLIEFASRDIEGKARAAGFIIEAHNVDSDLELVFNRRNRMWVNRICKFIQPKTRHIDFILMGSSFVWIAFANELSGRMYFLI